MTLDPTFKAKWVTALRSGLYQQTRGTLKNPVGYCCLGVACEVAGLVQEPRVGTPDTLFVGPSGDALWDLMPRSFGEQVGLTIEAQRRLAAMNDGENKSFTEIADYIEANL